MGIFSRTRDIIAANFNDLLDKADDPEKMIRMIIFEMEETLVEVRASAARTIADQKEMHRHTVKLDRLQADWGEKAQLALSDARPAAADTAAEASPSPQHEPLRPEDLRHLRLRERRGEVALNERAHLLSRAVVVVVVTTG